MQCRLKEVWPSDGIDCCRLEQVADKNQQNHQRHKIFHISKPNIDRRMVAFIKQFVLRFVLHHKTGKQRGTERGQHKQDVAADVVEGIENIFAEHGTSFHEP